MTRIERIDAMLDKHEITELLYAYCNAADRHDHVKCAASIMRTPMMITCRY